MTVEVIKENRLLSFLAHLLRVTYKQQIISVVVIAVLNCVYNLFIFLYVGIYRKICHAFTLALTNIMF